LSRKDNYKFEGEQKDGKGMRSLRQLSALWSMSFLVGKWVMSVEKGCIYTVWCPSLYVSTVSHFRYELQCSTSEIIEKVKFLYVQARWGFTIHWKTNGSHFLLSEWYHGTQDGSLWLSPLPSAFISLQWFSKDFQNVVPLFLLQDMKSWLHIQDFLRYYLVSCMLHLSARHLDEQFANMWYETLCILCCLQFLC
jgi:hypothetical protein